MMVLLTVAFNGRQPVITTGLNDFADLKGEITNE